MENKFRFYNTLTRTIETIIPNEDGKIAMYTCGPTVYHFAHIGNLRSYIMEDVLEKSLRYVGYDVKRVMNITDVGHLSSDADTGEDKMLKGAKREHKTVMEVAQFYTDAVHTPMSHFGDVFPYTFMDEVLTWLWKYKFDYKDLIGKGLAIAAEKEYV